MIGGEMGLLLLRNRSSYGGAARISPLSPTSHPQPLFDFAWRRETLKGCGDGGVDFEGGFPSRRFPRRPPVPTEVGAVSESRDSETAQRANGIMFIGAVWECEHTDTVLQDIPTNAACEAHVRSKTPPLT
ncbi:flagellar biosynthesis protein FliP [Anopheles sinensis]|uniref:Flagellar biosynthesis protein FliP n=1 Tax=Anopheles sinensis TaxID=74873 RepID=A0A084W9I9_ANOSI|nr:flagellar biosynthesis protein FliP [Anopheles sinensis]